MRSLAALVAAAAGLAGCGFQAPNFGPDGEPITVGFLATASLQDEASGMVTIPIGLNTVAEELVSVSYRFTGGTATNGADYVGSNNTITIPPGATEARIPLTINMDGLEEDLETIKLELSDPVGALLGTSQHTVTISRDILPRVKFESNSSQADEATSPVLRVSLDTPSAIEVSVDYVITGSATAGTDYNLAGGRLTFPAGTTSRDLMVPVSDDQLDEFDENFLVTLTNSTNVVVGSVASHDHLITDNDAEPTVAFQTATQTRQEDGLVVAVTVRLSAPSGKPIKVDLSPGPPPMTAAANGQDFLFTPTQLTFTPGTTQQTVNIVLLDDNTDEFDEAFTAVLTVQNGYNVMLGAITTNTITLTDDDNPPIVEFQGQSIIVNEGDQGTDQYNFDVQLSRASAKPITVPIAVSDLDATEGTDYTIAGNPIEIPPGMTSGRITVVVISDTQRENNSNSSEDVILTIPTQGLVNVLRGNSDLVRTVTIRDDD